MAISQNQRTELLTLLVGMFDGAPTSDLLSELATGLDNGATLEGYAYNLGNSAEFSSLYGTYLTSQEFAERFVENILGDNVAEALKAEGAQFVAGLMDAGATRGQAVFQAIQALAAVPEDDADWGDAVAQLNNKVEVAEYFALNGEYSGLSLEQMRSVTDGISADSATVDAKITAINTGSLFGNTGNDENVFELTAGTDRGADFVGTSSNDMFEAYLSQNSFAGGVSNTLSSADRLDGQGGIDTLYAELVPEFFGATADVQNRIDVQPTTSNIEIIELQARDLAANTSGVTLDAKSMTDIDKIGSSFSDGDLVIENLTTLESDGNLRNTGDLTVTMVHTDNFNSDQDASDLAVYFDEDYLVSGQTSEAQAFYFLLDEDANLANNPDLLNNINVDGIRFSLDGGATIIDLDAPEAATAGTHAGFVAALQAGLAELIAAGTVPAGTTLTLDPTITDFTFLDSGERSVDIPAIVLTTGDGSVVTPIGYSQVEDAIGEYDLYGRFNAQSQVSNDPISIKVELEKVGRDGEGGNLIIGGKDQNLNGDTDVDQADGIEVFNISVLGNEDKPSNLGSIMSTNGALRTVNIVTDAAFVDGDTYAALTVRGQDLAGTTNDESPFGGTLDTINANSFLGDLNIGQEYAAQDVNTLNAAGGGDVYFNANITADAEGVYNYATGTGSDEVIVTVQGDAVDDVNTSLTISTGSNDDKVQVVMGEDQAGLSQQTSNELQNLRINTGSGADEVDLDAYGKFYVATGEGSDFVRVNSVDENGDASTGSWTVGDDSGMQTFAERVLYKAELTLTFAGLESTVSINTTSANNFKATQLDINTALAAAIEDSPELSKLLELTKQDGTQQVTITSLVGGLNDLRIDIAQPEVLASGSTVGAGQVILSTSDVSSVLQGLIQTGVTVPNGSSAAAADVVTALATIDGNIDNTGTTGADYLAYADGGSSDSNIGISYSVINVGNGSNDLVVMHSHEDSANVLEINQTFGKVTVVNFHDISPNDVANQTEVGNHAIDFTHYLDNRTDDSVSNGNNFSEESIAVTLNTNAQLTGSAASTGTALANSVNMLNFDNTAGTLAWSDLTASNLVAALNGGTSVGGIVDGTLDAVASTANLVGDVQKHIVMVENDANVGEYKVFYLTSANNNTTGDFDTNTATLLGTLDFGASINFPLVGSAEWDAAIENLLTSKNDSTQIYDNADYTLAEATKTNDLTNNYSIEDTLENLLAANVNNPTGTREILVNAESITISDSGSDLDGEEVLFTGISLGSAGTAINFDDDAATLSLSELQLITGSSSGQYSLSTDVSDQLTIEGTNNADTVLVVGNASYIYNLNDGDDVLQVQGDNIGTFASKVQVNGGLGTDEVSFYNGNFGAQTIGGGANVTVTDAAFANMTGIEKVSGAGGNSFFTGYFSLTLGVNANTAFTSGVEVFSGLGSQLNLSAANATMVITATGDDRDDSITTGSGDDIINAGNGNDTIDGGAGADSIDAGAGNDTVTFDADDIATDSVDGGADSDTITAAGQTGPVTIDLTSTTDAYVNFENIIGSDGADTLTGDTSVNTINGGAGDDIIVAQDTDTIDGGADNDTVRFGAAVTSANLSNGDLLNVETVEITNTGDAAYDFSAQTEALTITGNTGADTITGGAGADTITGGAGDDILVAQDTDTIDGGADNDTVRFDSAVSAANLLDADLLNVETVEITNTGDAAYDFSAQTEALTITGNTGADTITGGADADTITGGAGADIITGGAGADIIDLTDADNAVDTIVYSAASDGTDIITGFLSGEDRIEIDGALQTQLDDVTVDTSFTWVSATDDNTSASETVDLSVAEAIFMNSSNSGVSEANLTNGGLVLQALNDQFNNSVPANSESWFVVVESSDNAGTFGVYVVTDAGNGDIDNSGDSIQILGVVTGDTVATSDFIMA
ncbi:beta strand repeat-containing protein [Marinomonas gallaica]|uniref:beta strand repeat-containing protein n=1 Tax=Marinomonas gallaica TaxID=1806667 RepID=UPI00082963A0|nr:calcium-binding protein [Marinomonas gallaica]